MPPYRSPVPDGTIALDDARWSTLRHAYGAATDTPEALRALARTRWPDDIAIWSDLYGSLCHQGAVFPATFAAVPHLVRFVGPGDLRRRVDVLSFVGALAMDPFARDAAPPELAPAYDAALSTMRDCALDILRAANSAGRRAKGSIVPSLIAGTVALHCGAVRGLSLCEGNSVEAGWFSGSCPACEREVRFIVDAEGIREIESLDGKRRTPQRVLEPSRLRPALPAARTIITNESNAPWPAELALAFTAALADELDDAALGEAVIQLDAVIECSRCRAAVRVADHGY